MVPVVSGERHTIVPYILLSQKKKKIRKNKKKKTFMPAGLNLHAERILTENKKLELLKFTIYNSGTGLLLWVLHVKHIIIQSTRARKIYLFSREISVVRGLKF